MGIRKIVWSKKALKVYKDVFLWYRQECGEQFAQKFFQRILNTIETLSQMPSIGTVEKVSPRGKTTYYGFLSHSKYRIVYRFTKTTLYIAGIRATVMNSK